ncbi:hypothetical protein SAICODRAFT_31074 [Saitoella complicata NRRL Y-17804]|uniref:uncharacterized protein n=1 Tax=Saitoella complicata (strain BCRC 22490 / CBS 7301 / JCM 7358 / NBRC 10748 / NRRL Y-17804) TaxID=698492 RepID=UPI00086799C5|nr:uncharacterized protein SAICODRAFT_31074 [Saitoella complicata NRRL Y-17804]ODQ51702.1 hypothetical protein SAICODRAFT_31074 [Saitoella complicata NRRL Y-17804]
MIEGGARVITDVLQEKAAGTVIVTIAPVYVGNEGVGVDVEAFCCRTKLAQGCSSRTILVTGRMQS